MSPPPAALEHQSQTAELASAAVRGARAEWAQLDTNDLRASWAASLPRVLALVAAAQRSAAGLSGPYLARLLGADAAAGQVEPAALSGIASDGRPLPSLLTQPMIRVLSYLASGRTVADALAAGQAMLELIVGTQVADAGRVADLVGITARPGVAYTRVVDLPACGRCIVLAGREYSYSTGFQRHPRCDCAMVPVRSGDSAPILSPRELFDQMSPDEQARRFGPAGAEAIREGADIDQVVNAGRGMSTAGGRAATTEGTTRRGHAARRIGGDFTRQSGQRFARSTRVRLMPEQILADADSREAAVAGLREHGYLT